MSAFFELRTYKIFPGKMNEWIDFMEKTIIPFQVSKGMIIHGSFTVDKEKETYIWIRRFKNQEHKDELYKNVYESNEWINDIAPIVTKLIDRDAIIVKNLKSTDLSIMK
jgi:hypothetical protein|tara:strand:- start:1538 stop:1864 length:327 start_codon:yes stop_codon:yes gene_type:complete